MPVEGCEQDVVDPAMADDLMPGSVQFLNGFGKNFGSAPVGVDGSLDLIAVESVENPINARPAALLAVRKRCIIGLVSFVSAIL